MLQFILKFIKCFSFALNNVLYSQAEMELIVYAA